MTPETRADARHQQSGTTASRPLAGTPSRAGRNARAGRAASGARGRRLACASVVAISVICFSALAVSGCGQASAVNSYILVANNILAPVNAKENELKSYWGKSLLEQEGLPKSLADFRKALSDAQDKLDSNDSPDVARKLDDLLGRAVDQGRALADLNTQFADYLGQMAPQATQAAYIVGQLQGLQKSQDVPTTITGLLDKAKQIDSSLRTIQPGPTFQLMHQEFQQYIAVVIAKLTEAQQKLSDSRYYPSTDSSDSQGTVPGEISQETQHYISAIDSQIQTIVEGWGGVNGQIGGQLDAARQSTGLTGKSNEVENYIGQAVEQIKQLQQQYK